MKVLVTGGAGFIGSWTVEALAAGGDAVRVIDSLTPQVHGMIPRPSGDWFERDGVEFVRGDVRDERLVDGALDGVDAVVHLAAETGTGQSMYQIAHYCEVNGQATAQLFEAIATRHRHIRRVVLASSRAIYGEGAYRLGDRILVPAPREKQKLQAGEFQPTGPNGETLTPVATPETVTPRPASVYAATKCANETLGRIFSDAYGVDVIALRFQNVYGERQSLRNPYTGILSIFANRMRQGLPINIFEDGQESRDFVHVSDVACAIGLALDRPLGGFHAINIGSGVPTTVWEVAKILRQALASSSELTVTGDFRVGDIRNCYADLRRAREVLGFVPKVDMATGLTRFCSWATTQPVQEDHSANAMRELAQRGLGQAQRRVGL